MPVLSLGLMFKLMLLFVCFSNEWNLLSDTEINFY